MKKEMKEKDARLANETERAADAQAAAGRAAAAMADVAKKLTEANAGKKAAEDQLNELRQRVENLDQTVEDAAKATDARDAAVLQAAAAEQRARAADQRAEEAVAAAAETAKEGEERKRRFAKLQEQFKEREEALLARAEEAERAVQTQNDTPSAEMEQMVGEAIEEAEAATREAREESGKLRAQADRLAAELDAVTRRTEELETDLADARSKASALEEMAKVRTETSNVIHHGGSGPGGIKDGGQTGVDVAAIEAAAVKRGAEAASDEVRRARADAKAARDEVESLKARLETTGVRSNPNPDPNPKDVHAADENDLAARERLARVLARLRGSSSTPGQEPGSNDSSLWSWAFGSSEENAAAEARASSAGVASRARTTRRSLPPPLETLIADFESAESGAWAHETLEQARESRRRRLRRGRPRRRLLSAPGTNPTPPPP